MTAMVYLFAVNRNLWYFNSPFDRFGSRFSTEGYCMSSVAPVMEPLVSADSHVHFTDEWVKARLPARLAPVWDEAARRLAVHDANELRAGQKNLELEDFVDPDAARDPGHFEPHGKLRAMDRDGVQAEVIFPEVGGAKYCT